MSSGRAMWSEWTGMSSIHFNFTAYAVDATPDILSGDEFRWFWVTFEEKNGGLIEFGAGNVVGVDRYEFNSF